MLVELLKRIVLISFECGLPLLWQENCTAGKVSFYDLKVIVKHIMQYYDMTVESQSKGARKDGQ